MIAHEAPRLDRDVQSDIGTRLRQRFEVSERDIPSALERLLDALRACEAEPVLERR